MMIREMRPEDMPEVTAVRISVRENHLSVEQMAQRGITAESVIADLLAGHYGGWVAEQDGRIVAFSMADARDGSIFALFTAPGCERRGHGAALLAMAEAWLKRRGLRQAWLSTAKGSTAARFYAARGWLLDPEASADPEDEIYRKALTTDFTNA